MNSVLDQLHDIQGLDPIGMWPLAAGWWVLMGLAGGIFAALGLLAVAKIRYWLSWRQDATKKLRALEQRLEASNAQEVLQLLSEYLRRIAVRRYSRKECAGLSGRAWLEWLTARDPVQFDWTQEGRVLIELPYAPPDIQVPLDTIKTLIQAARRWVR